MTSLPLDKIVATGGTAIAAVSVMKQHGAKNIIMISLLGSREGADALSKAHPDVEIFLGCMEQCLTEHGFILPGLGDAGDRLFGTQ